MLIGVVFTIICVYIFIATNVMWQSKGNFTVHVWTWIKHYIIFSFYEDQTENKNKSKMLIIIW
jgi:hypothetical protein